MKACISVLVLTMAATQLVAEDKPMRVDVQPVQRREATLADAASILARRDAPAPKVPDRNIFAQPGTQVAPSAAEAPAPVVPTKRTDAQLLQLIADRLSPTGVVNIGGQPLLLFGEKRCRVGDPITIVFEDAEYTLNVTRIESKRFSLKYHSEEYTRLINPARVP